MTTDFSTDGVQLIEVEGLLPLSTLQNRYESSVAILRWLATEVQRTLDAEAVPVEVQVVCSCYLGWYPTLGLHYRANCGDIGRRVEALAEALLRDAPVASLVQFLAESKEDFAATVEQFQACGRGTWR